MKLLKKKNKFKDELVEVNIGNNSINLDEQPKGNLLVKDLQKTQFLQFFQRE